MRLVRDVDVDARPGTRAGGGVRPRGGRPPVPRVRVPDADRSPAAARRRAARRTRSRRCARSAMPASRRPRASGRGGAPERPGEGSRGRRTGSLQLSMDFDVVSGGGGAPARAVAAPSRRRRRRSRLAPRRSRWRPATLPGALAAAIVDPGRIELADADRVATLEPWLREQDAVGVGARRRRSAAARRDAAVARGRRRGRPGRRRRRRRGARPPCATSSSGSTSRLVGHEVKPLLTARFAEDASAAPVADRLRHPDRRLPRQRRAPGPEDRRRRRGAPRPRAAADGRRPPADRVAGLEALSAVAVRPSLEQALRDDGVDRLFEEIELPLIPILARMEAAGIALDQAALGALEREFAAEIDAPRGRDLRRRRPPVHDRLAQAAGRHPVRRARPPQGPQDEDRLLDRRHGPRGAARRPPGHRARPRLADLHQAAVHLRRGAADAHRARRPTAHAVPPGRRGDRATSARRTRTSRTSRSARRSAAGSATRSSPARRTRRSSPRTTARSSCGSSPTSRATTTSPTRSPARPTSTARRRPACCARTRRT